jgi:hypothetical protein|tara:strand:+ start:426 stop:563 length:138 start_codon:yes stop_codon:yes gene_type:complete
LHLLALLRVLFGIRSATGLVLLGDTLGLHHQLVHIDDRLPVYSQG